MASSPPRKPKRRPKLDAKEAVYPAATLAFYGPDDQRASKAVAAVVLSDQDTRPAAVMQWSSDDADIRTDSGIRQQIMNFLQSENVQRVVMADRIIGCPHVEGIDYPRGEKCPFCPFWANRDRWTGQLLEDR